MKLSVLDQSVACSGRGSDAAIRESLSLAVHAESLGYHRYWASEHHNLPTIVGTAPEVLLAAVAARTQRIRLGSAGVMLPHYSAYKVAEVFRVLDALAPGRMDLGVGRAPGGDRHTAQALNPHVSGMAEDFPAQVMDLMAWLGGAALRGARALPQPPSGAELARTPDLWMLGSSDYGAQLAAHLGVPYAFAYFFTDGVGVEQALQLYRSLYRPSSRHPKPLATVCVWALACDTEDQARQAASSRDRWRLDRARGHVQPLQAPEDILRQGFSEAELSSLAPMRAKAFVGSAAQVGQQLRALAKSLELDELVINTWAHDPAVRHHSYSLLAREFGLQASGSTATTTAPTTPRP